MYIAQVVLTNTRLGFGGSLPSSLQVAKNCNFGQIFRQVAAYRSSMGRNMGNRKQLHSPQRV